MLIFILFSTALPSVFAADLKEHRTQCGVQAAPSGLIIDKLGIPELLCETPSCMLGSSDEKNSVNHYAKCSNEFVPIVCKGKHAWTGGLIDSNNGTHRVLKTECCEYEGISPVAHSRKITLKSGESYHGGPVKSMGRITHFDVVKEVRKLVSPHNRVKYEITVVRMLCPGADTEELLSDSAVLREGEYYEYGEDGKSVEYMPYSRRYRGNQRRRYPARDRIRGSSASRELQRPIRRRMHAARRDQLFPLQNEEYDFYESDFMPVFSRRSRNGKPGYLIHSRPRTYADLVFDGTGENAEYPKETIVSNTLPATYNVKVASAQHTYSIEAAQPTQQIIETVQQPLQQPLQPPQQPPPPPQQAQPVETVQVQPAQQSYSGNYPPVQQAAPSSYRAFGYYPQSYTGYGGGVPDLGSAFGSLQCFSGNMTVQTPAGSKLISDLEIGDMVLSIQESFVSYSPVVMHLHKAEHVDAVFNRIVTEDGYDLELTDYHLIYSSKCEGDDSKNINLIHAHKVREGDCVYAIPEDDNRLKATKVIRISKIERRGIYSPLTASGDILVNNVLASCHSNMAAQTLQQTFFSWWRALNRVFTRLSKNAESSEHDVPFGVGYLTSVIDILLPSSMFI